jgi:uncharacterized protein (UPF0332 family)/predicted nucleotidyltransferase
MEFKITKKVNPNVQKYHKHDMDTAYEFTKKIYKEFGQFLKAVVLFGSTARGQEGNDIDILIVVDDTSIVIDPEVTEAYRLITERIIAEVSKRIHVTTIKFSSFWQYMRSGDPIAVNILREGVALVDTGFFTPMQVLLYQGRIRPSEEAIWGYYEMAPRSLLSSRIHIMQATLDLYWSVIDSAHAVLMKMGEVPPTPSHVSMMMREKLVKTGKVEKRYADIMERFYRLSKMIVHRKVKEIHGLEFEKYYHDAEEFVNRMKQFINRK